MKIIINYRLLNGNPRNGNDIVLRFRDKKDLEFYIKELQENLDSFTDGRTFLDIDTYTRIYIDKPMEELNIEGEKDA